MSDQTRFRLEKFVIKPMLGLLEDLLIKFPENKTSPSSPSSLDPQSTKDLPSLEDGNKTLEFSSPEFQMFTMVHFYGAPTDLGHFEETSLLI